MNNRTAVNHKIRKHFNELIYNVARYTEIVLSIVILVVIALSGLRLIYTTAGTSILNMDTDFFTTFLSQALSLVVGVEFVKMLCRHSAPYPDTDRYHRNWHSFCHPQVSHDRQ